MARALRRRKFTAAGTFVLVLAATAAALLVLPRIYHAEVTLLAQRNQVMAALSNPGRTIPWDADVPTRAATETVLRRDNLVSLIKQTRLLDRWELTRAPIYKVKDALMRPFRGPSNDEESLDALVGELERRIIVWTGEGTVTISVYWPDARQAYELAEAAQQSFLEARQVAETSAIAASISILERYATSLQEQISRTSGELQRVQTQAMRAAQATARALARPTDTPPPPEPPAPRAPLVVSALRSSVESNPEIVRIRASLESTRQAVARLEELRQRQISELQVQLAQLRRVFTEQHPSVQSLQESINTLSRDSPQLLGLRAEAQSLDAEYERRVAAALRAEEEELKAEYAGRAAAARSSPDGAGEVQGTVPSSVNTPQPAPESEPGTWDPSGEKKDYLSLHLNRQQSQLENVLERIDSARIELATSQAAFKYRYSVVRPAQVPRTPIKPNVPAVMVAGVFGALVLAFAAAVCLDFLSGRIVEPWQVERQLGLPILVRLKRL